MESLAVGKETDIFCPQFWQDAKERERGEAWLGRTVIWGWSGSYGDSSRLCATHTHQITQCPWTLHYILIEGIYTVYEPTSLPVGVDNGALLVPHHTIVPLPRLFIEGLPH